MSKNQDLAKPENLDLMGETAYDTVMAVLSTHGLTDTGGCRTFYSPKEWAERGEQYGLRSVLIVCHDGGDLALFCNSNYEHFHLMEALRVALENVGLYAESCTGWYTAVYPIR